MKFGNIYGVVAAAALLIATIGCGDRTDPVIDSPPATDPAMTPDPAAPADPAATDPAVPADPAATDPAVE